MLVAAGLTAWGGYRLARQETVVRKETGREEASQFATDLSREITRLETLYASHLEELASNAPVDDAFRLRQACDDIVGIKQFAVLHMAGVDGDKAEDVYFDFRSVDATTWRPTLDSAVGARPGQRFLKLTADDMEGFGFSNGWIEKPGWPLLFWSRRSFESIVVITPDVPTVANAMHGWIRNWHADAFEPVRVGKGIVEVKGPGGVLAAVGESGGEDPDLLRPIDSRFGRWTTAVWDEREQVVTYAAGTLVLAAGLAILVALLGFFGFIRLSHLMRMSEQRVSFVNRVSHELRTPLTNILLNTDLAQNAGSADEARDRLSLVREEAGRLSRLIANVLTFSRRAEETDHINRGVLGVRSCIEKTLEPFRPSLRRAGVEVILEVDDTIRAVGDEDVATQVIGNLVSNVEKYAADGGLLKITARESDGRVAISIIDRGPGISGGARERIFKPFVRLDSRVREGVSGTGLGLSIARDLAERLGGSLVLDPGEEETGALFIFTLPAAPGNVMCMDEKLAG